MSTNGKPLVSVTLDDILALTPAGPSSTAISNNLFGINHRQTPTLIQSNKDHYGFTFFTRPQLNMTSDNIRFLRNLIPLLTNEPNSYARYIRCTLDPRLQIGYGENPALSCPLVDPKQAFIPLLTNHCNSISGWPDLETPTHTSKAGMYKEEHIMVDGILENYTAYTLTTNWRNTRGNLIINLLHVWQMYQTAVFTGVLHPYPDFILDNTLDYNTRVYRLTLDPTKTVVQGIAACGAGVFTALPKGNQYDFSNDKPYNDANAEISAPLQCSGAIYDDPILIDQFNKTVQMFNHDMRDSRRNANMTQITLNLGQIFNNRGYPRINPNTMHLEWWIDNQTYNAKLNAMGQVQKMIGTDSSDVNGDYYI
jgi:hypothetical protein